VLRYGLDELVLNSFSHPGLRLTGACRVGGAQTGCAARPAPARGAGALGPIFVKFGQVLSTRRDLLPPTWPTNWPAAGPVPPFDSAGRGGHDRARLRSSPLSEIFTSFEREPVASASIAQVHFATCKDRSGRERRWP
jgi:ubiquinone biosynthesis protein